MKERKSMQYNLLSHVTPSLKNLEETIETGVKGYIKAGQALEYIKSKKLYKGAYDTYEEYCRKRWGFTPQHANRLISAAKIEDKIKSEPTGSVSPQTESQIRALSKSKNPEIDWKDIQEATGKEQPTAKEITAYLKEKYTENTIDAELIEDDPDAIETDTAMFLVDVIDNPYEMGSKTGRPQVSVAVDDITVSRLNQLREHFNIPKASVVAQALLLLEKTVELQSQKDKT